MVSLKIISLEQTDGCQMGKGLDEQGEKIKKYKLVATKQPRGCRAQHREHHSDPGRPVYVPGGHQADRRDDLIPRKAFIRLISMPYP